MSNNLIKGLREGDHACFKEIYEKHHFKVYLFINRFTQQEADTEDIVQNVFIHLWNYRKNISEDSVLGALLFKSSKQEISRWYKKQDNFPLLPGSRLREDMDTEYGTEEDTAIQLEKIAGLLEQIPESRRKIFTLNKFEQLSYKEIAEEMSMTPTAVAKQIAKTLRFLREHSTHDQAFLWFGIILYSYN